MLTHILIASMICLGLNAATWDGMIFDKPAEWLQKRLPYWLCSPLFMCPICMASIWGTAYYFCCISTYNILHYISIDGNGIFFYLPNIILKDWTILVLSISGFNSIVIRYAK